MALKLPGKVVKFPKSKPCKRKLRKFQHENQMERKFPGKCFRKLGCTAEGCLLFRKLCKITIFYSVLVLLATITASWTRIRNGLPIFYFSILPL